MDVYILGALAVINRKLHCRQKASAFSVMTAVCVQTNLTQLCLQFWQHVLVKRKKGKQKSSKDTKEQK